MKNVLNSLLPLVCLLMLSCYADNNKHGIEYIVTGRPNNSGESIRVDLAFDGDDLLFAVVQETSLGGNITDIEYTGEKFIKATISNSEEWIDLKKIQNTIYLIQDKKIVLIKKTKLKRNRLIKLIEKESVWDELLSLNE